MLAKYTKTQQKWTTIDNQSKQQAVSSETVSKTIGLDKTLTLKTNSIFLVLTMGWEAHPSPIHI